LHDRKNPVAASFFLRVSYALDSWLAFLYSRFLKPVGVEFLDAAFNVEALPILKVGFVVIGVNPHADLFFAIANAAIVEQAPGILRIEKQIGVTLYPVFQNKRKKVGILPVVPIFFGYSPEPFSLAFAEAGIFAENPFVSEIQKRASPQRKRPPVFLEGVADGFFEHLFEFRVTLFSGSVHSAGGSGVGHPYESD